MGVVVDCAQNVLEHAIDIRQDIVVPIAQHAIAVRFENSRAAVIGSRSLSVLTTIDLDNDAPRVTSKVDDVAANSNLATEMCLGWEAGGAGATRVSAPLPSARTASGGRVDVAVARLSDRAWPKLAAHPVWTYCRAPTPTPTPNPSPQGGGEQTEHAAH